MAASLTRSESCRRAMQKRWAGRRDYWRELITRQVESGLSIAQFCVEEGVHPSSFFLWRRKLGLGPSPTVEKGDRRSEGARTAVTPPASSSPSFNPAGSWTLTRPDPAAYLKDVLRRINGHNSNRIHELLPHNWKPAPKPWD